MTTTREQRHNVEDEALKISSVIHEIQGRLATILMFCEELSSGIEQPAKLKSRLNRIHWAATETQRILEALRRLDDNSPLERVTIDLGALCSRIFDRYSSCTPQFERSLIRIQSNIYVEGDPDQIDILLDNLIGNALKFTSRREAPEVRITASSDSLRCVIHVSDNGVGVAPEDTERMFRPFTRCHAGFAGTGIGLSTARRIVERHGGRIWATGEAGLGTTISFFL